MDVRPASPRASEVVAALAERWNATRESVLHVRDSANAVFQFQAEGARRFLRITEDSHRNRQQLDAELDFIRFLASHGLAVACPVLSNQKAFIETARTSDGQTWHAVVFAAAPGRHFRLFSPDIAAPLFQAWGSAMGRLHALSRTYVPAESKQRPAWTALDTTACTDSMIPAAEKAARREYVRVSEWLASLPSPRESWGLIHGDFERTNFVIDGATLTAYDFDDACYHWYLADVAHALWIFRRAPAADREQFLVWFAEGYQQHCAVAAGWRESLSWFVRLRSLTLFLYRLRGGGACGSEGRWEQRMRADFETAFHW